MGVQISKGECGKNLKIITRGDVYSGIQSNCFITVDLLIMATFLQMIVFFSICDHRLGGKRKREDSDEHDDCIPISKRINSLHIE